MVQHAAVSTTCTASHIINWDIPNLKADNQKLQVNARLSTVDSLINQGFKRDFALLFITVTDNQMKRGGLDEFLPKCGFELAYKGEKFDENKGEGTLHRHKETGDIYLWATSPKTYQEALVAYKKELTELKDKIDPPKKPDPKRQALPRLLLSALRKKGFVVDNASVDNPLHQVLTAGSETKLARFLTVEYGWDPRSMEKTWGVAWTQKTTRALKEAHEAWKNELI